MTDREFRRTWLWAMAGAAAVVAVAAIVLLVIIVTGRAIRSNVRRIQAIARDIVANTQAIWRLADTEKAAAELEETARSIRQHAAEVLDAAQAPSAQER